MQELIKKILNIVRISMHAYALNDVYVYHFLIHKPGSHKIIVRCLWHGDNECLALEMDKFIRIQVRFNHSMIQLKLTEIMIDLLIFNFFSSFSLAARWRKHRRQYLSKMLRPFSSIGAINSTPAQTMIGPIVNSTNHLHRRLEYGNNDMESEFNSSTFLEESSSLGATGDTSDSKDSQHIKEDIGKYG